MTPPESILETENETWRILQALALPTAVCLAGLALFWSLPAQAQSFSCAEASRPAEFAICNSENLLIMDEQVGRTFTEAYLNASSAPQRQSVARQHSDWVKRRNACGNDFTCLNLRYEERLTTLKSQSL